MEPNLRSRISLRSIRATKRRNRNNGKPKARPHPCPSLDRAGFALHVAGFCNARAKRRAARTISLIRHRVSGGGGPPRRGGGGGAGLNVALSTKVKRRGRRPLHRANARS